ncbi:MAG: prepilin-type N-terminal cleavage/methylation domain-containing protein, partial [Planctomycetaceae bacterium]
MLERRSLLPDGLALACRVTAGRPSSRAQAQGSRPARTFPVRDRGGFTLFEMLLVLVLISIAMALAWPA